MITSNHDVRNWLRSALKAFGFFLILVGYTSISNDVSIIGDNPNYAVLVLLIGSFVKALYNCKLAVNASNHWNASEFNYSISQILTGLILVLSSMSMALYFMSVQQLLIEYVVTVTCLTSTMFFAIYTLVHLFNLSKVVTSMTTCKRKDYPYVNFKQG